MKSSIQAVVALLVVLAATKTCTAEPMPSGRCATGGVLPASVCVAAIPANGTVVGPGLVAWDLFLVGSALSGLSAAVDLRFDGDIEQVPTAIGSLTTSTLTDLEDLAILGPDPVKDSYLFTGSSPTFGLPAETGGAGPTWGLNVPSGIDHPAPTTGGAYATGIKGYPMWMAAGTSVLPAGTTQIQVAHIVIDPPIFSDDLASLAVFGTIAVGGQVGDIDTVFQIPEPSTFAMLATGMFLLVGLGWRRRQAPK